MSDLRDVDRRLALLEQTAQTTATVLTEIRTEMRDLRTQHHTDFLWLLSLQLAGFASLLAVMAHGFHWL
jgi:hypothetical protein